MLQRGHPYKTRVLIGTHETLTINTWSHGKINISLLISFFWFLNTGKEIVLDEIGKNSVPICGKRQKQAFSSVNFHCF